VSIYNIFWSSTANRASISSLYLPVCNESDCQRFQLRNPLCIRTCILR